MAVVAITSPTHTQHASTPAPEPCSSPALSPGLRGPAHARAPADPTSEGVFVREVPPPHSGSSAFAGQNGDQPTQKAGICPQLWPAAFQHVTLFTRVAASPGSRVGTGRVSPPVGARPASAPLAMLTGSSAAPAAVAAEPSSFSGP